MNTKCINPASKVTTRFSNRCGFFLIFILWALCTGCVGLTSADSKNGSLSSTTPPTISITAPGQGATVSGFVSVTTSVSINTISVQFKVDGTNTGAALTSAPFDYSLDTTKLTVGTHSLTAEATDASGQTTLSSAVSIAVANSGAPSISITSPATGATVSGIVPITANASSNTSSVQFKLDGANSGAAVTSAPFASSLNTTKLSDGTFTLTAVATSSTGKTSTSPSSSIKVNNRPPLSRLLPRSRARRFRGLSQSRPAFPPIPPACSSWWTATMQAPR